MATQLAIQTQIHSRYQVFEASGRLPFSIVFGFCRRSSNDTDPRPLVLSTSGSVLDVPSALANGLLTLHERDPHDIHHYIDVDLSSLSKKPTTHDEYLSLPSPVDRTEHWRNSFVTYLYRIEADSELASILEPGKKYTIRLASRSLGVKWWAYGDRDDNGDPQKPSENAELVNSKPTASSATFTVVQSLSWPPQVETRMRLASLPDQSAAIPPLDVSVTNTGERPILVQTRNDQSFLVPWGPFQPLSESYFDSLLRIIDANPHKPPTSCLRILDAATGQIVQDSKSCGVCSLRESTASKRPKVEWLVKLLPGEPLVRQVSIDHIVCKLPDGLYILKMEERGCWWCDGDVKPDEDGRVPKVSYNYVIPPVTLETDDVVKLRIREGKVVDNSTA